MLDEFNASNKLTAVAKFMVTAITEFHMPWACEPPPLPPILTSASATHASPTSYPHLCLRHPCFHSSPLPPPPLRSYPPPSLSSSLLKRSRPPPLPRPPRSNPRPLRSNSLFGRSAIDTWSEDLHSSVRCLYKYGTYVRVLSSTLQQVKNNKKSRERYRRKKAKSIRKMLMSRMNSIQSLNSVINKPWVTTPLEIDYSLAG